MNNIVWQKPDGTYAITTIVDGSDPALHAAELQSNLAIPSSWVVYATSVPDVSSYSAPTLSQVKTDKKLSIETSCAGTITGGVSSSALGVAHTYPSQQVDQMNLTAVVLRSTLAGFTSANLKTLDAGWLNHTAAQIQQVGIDVESFISTQLQRSSTLQAQIDAATTSDAVQAIVW